MSEPFISDLKMQKETYYRLVKWLNEYIKESNWLKAKDLITAIIEVQTRINSLEPLPFDG